MSLPLRNPFKGDKSQISNRAFIEDAAVRYFLNVPDEDISTPARLMFVLEEAFWFYYDYMLAFSQTKNYASNFKKFLTYVVKYCPQVTYLSKASESTNENNDTNIGWTEKDIDVALAQFREYKSTIPVRGCCILNEKLDSILLVQDATSKTWSFPRGKIGKDEDDVKCAIRECFEETGLDMAQHIRADKFMNTNMQGKHIRIYFCTDVPMNVVEKFKPMSTYEINDMKWFSVKSLKKLHGSKSKRHTYLVNALIFKISKFVNEENIERKFVKAETELKRILNITTSYDPQVIKEKYVGGENSGVNLLNMIKKTGNNFEFKQGNSAVSTPQLTPQNLKVSNSGSNLLNVLKFGKEYATNNENKKVAENTNGSLLVKENGKSLLSLLQKKSNIESEMKDLNFNDKQIASPKSNASSLLNLLQHNPKKQEEPVLKTPIMHTFSDQNLAQQQSVNLGGSPMVQFQHLINQQRQQPITQQQLSQQFQPQRIHHQQQQQNFSQQAMMQPQMIGTPNIPFQQHVNAPVMNNQSQQFASQQQMYMPPGISSSNIQSYPPQHIQANVFQTSYMNQNRMPQQEQKMTMSPFHQASTMSPNHYVQQVQSYQHENSAPIKSSNNPRKALLSLLNNAQQQDERQESLLQPSKNVLLNDLNKFRTAESDQKTEIFPDESKITSNSELFQLLNNRKKTLITNPQFKNTGQATDEDDFEDFEEDV
ncbi:hypothetical protein QEN19_004291 [Hanseniaspora menglaensis]